MDIQTRIDSETVSIKEEIVAIRRHIHKNPEIGLETYKTADYIATALDESTIAFKHQVGKAGVVATIEGREPGPCILIRADMDALPLTEITGLGYASEVEGKMHACGHDLHAAALVGVAKILTRIKPHIKGSYKLAFQPGEETLNGAAAMIDEGLLENPTPRAALGFHNWPSLDAGVAAYHPVFSFAGSQAFTITLKGLSGHGAHPHSAIDTIAAAANFITQLQTIVSREVAPVKPAVVTVGRIEGGTAENIIADQVVMKGTMRALEPEVLDRMRETILRLLDGLATSMRINREISFTTPVPPLINDKRILAMVLPSARSALGEEKVIKIEEGSMGTEDFAYISSTIPSVYLRIGSKAADNEVRMVHRPDFAPNEAFLPVAIKLITRLAVDLADQL